MDTERLKKMASAVRTGGKGSVRRKKKAVHKTTTTDDKRLQSTLKRIGVNAIPAIDEVNIFKDDFVIQFQNPKVQASIAANTWVVSGSPQTKRLQDVLPSILNQLGPDNLDNLRRLAEQFQKQVPAAAAPPAQEDDDDDLMKRYLHMKPEGREFMVCICSSRSTKGIHLQFGGRSRAYLQLNLELNDTQIKTDSNHYQNEENILG
ncbi:nascent polypeptide-associated complex subunit beta-like [Asparagus officinalis]|uniref:nascent polypeptide-associated complex subunit beta-like n=1 Tax=Asparagus officinalis TaxID=4686 RepID=UPI00098DFD1A|nr:nascent polypeptide-associated complex subunit beta-like [Asparagus officinalis]